ncbi:hypothetical protein Q0590_08220 [Rhodocytophaga aerolata]|uniref:Uncharacterized protein n=1 Tax=Rhodocytophaga aerolata TaxID=455078 RepID=A0ABT8R4R9_9BACT|nr:hypothetical protein [Rhodocytophaga aerolata]MDO1446233.1 hypothetical protein [Rhodocytophaga aerolata]
MSKIKVTKQKDSTNRDFFTPEKAGPQPLATAHAQKVRAVTAPPIAQELHLKKYNL